MDRKASVIVRTQASTKVYKSIERETCEQALTCRIDDDAKLIYLPDPITCFAKSAFVQQQVFHIHSSSNLMCLDWMSGGRKRMRHAQEQWQFHRYDSSNVIYVDNVPIIVDRVVLTNNEAFDLFERMQGCHVFGVLFVLGSEFDAIHRHLANKSDRTKSPNVVVQLFEGVHASISPCIAQEINITGTIVRFAAIEVEPVYNMLQNMLSLLGYQYNIL